MSPKEKYGDEFFYEAHVLKKADGSEHPIHDIGVCIVPRDDEASSLACDGERGWAVESRASTLLHSIF